MIRTPFLLAFLVILAVPAWATTFEKVTLVSVYDGDTITVTLLGVHPLFGERIAVRIRGIDTPEIRGKCQEEKEGAIAARDFLRELLARAARIDLVDVMRGKFFRIVATVRADGVDVAAALVKNGLGRPYGGGKREGWCN